MCSSGPLHMMNLPVCVVRRWPYVCDPSASQVRFNHGGRRSPAWAVGGGPVEYAKEASGCQWLSRCGLQGEVGCDSRPTSCIGLLTCCSGPGPGGREAGAYTSPPRLAGVVSCAPERSLLPTCLPWLRGAVAWRSVCTGRRLGPTAQLTGLAWHDILQVGCKPWAEVGDNIEGCLALGPSLSINLPHGKGYYGTRGMLLGALREPGFTFHPTPAVCLLW